MSAALNNAAKEDVGQFAKKEADKALHARRSSSGAAATASSNGNGNSEAAGAAGAGKKSTGVSPLKQRVGTCAVTRLCREL